MVYPERYKNRLQTYLKHEILREYLRSWAQKIASFADRLWFVDAFSGPWESQDPEGTDTSAFIGLAALNEAVAVQRSKGRRVSAGAILVEPSRKSFEALKALAGRHAGLVAAHPLEGTFGDNIDRIGALIRQDPAFVLVDPTGWKGADMALIASVTQAPCRDVMVNVMYDFLNRFVDVPWDFLREQMRDLFGIAEDDVPKDHDEERLMRFYREQLRRHTGLSLVADVSVPVPEKDRTYYRLVVGSENDRAVELFRSAERRVLGRIAAEIRTLAKDERRRKAPQELLFSSPTPPLDPLYAEASIRGCREARTLIPSLLESGPRPFRDLWRLILQDCHIPLTELKKCVSAMADDGEIVVQHPLGKRSVGDATVLSLPGSR